VAVEEKVRGIYRCCECYWIPDKVEIIIIQIESDSDFVGMTEVLMLMHLEDHVLSSDEC
jgi:hypothetical protein